MRKQRAGSGGGIYLIMGRDESQHGCNRAFTRHFWRTLKLRVWPQDMVPRF